MAGAPSAMLFNAGILSTAVFTVAAAVGFYQAARAWSAGRIWPALAAVPLGLFGVGLGFGALFPMPDPRHGGFGLGMAVHAAPLLLAVAIRPVPRLRCLSRYLLVATVLMLVFLAPMMGVGGLVTQANVGLFQRLYALTVFSWIGVAAYGLLRSAGGQSERKF